MDVSFRTKPFAENSVFVRSRGRNTLRATVSRTLLAIQELSFTQNSQNLSTSLLFANSCLHSIPDRSHFHDTMDLHNASTAAVFTSDGALVPFSSLTIGTLALVYGWETTVSKTILALRC